MDDNHYIAIADITWLVGNPVKGFMRLSDLNPAEFLEKYKGKVEDKLSVDITSIFSWHGPTLLSPYVKLQDLSDENYGYDWIWRKTTNEHYDERIMTTKVFKDPMTAAFALFYPRQKLKAEAKELGMKPYYYEQDKYAEFLTNTVFSSDGNCCYTLRKTLNFGTPSASCSEKYFKGEYDNILVKYDFSVLKTEVVDMCKPFEEKQDEKA